MFKPEQAEPVEQLQRQRRPEGIKTCNQHEIPARKWRSGVKTKLYRISANWQYGESERILWWESSILGLRTVGNVRVSRYGAGGRNNGTCVNREQQSIAGGGGVVP